jgi:hypothetical protein
MSTQASVHSVHALKDLRAHFALFAEDVQAALGSVDMEARRTVQWLQHDRRSYWQEQVKRRREAVSEAQADLFRRKLSQSDESAKVYTEQKENLRRAEAALRDAEQRLALIKKWEPKLQQAILEYRASSRRIADFARGDVPRALALLGRMIDALEAYLRVAPPSGAGPVAPLDAIADAALAEDVASETTPREESTTEPANEEVNLENAP